MGSMKTYNLVKMATVTLSSIGVFFVITATLITLCEQNKLNPIIPLALGFFELLTVCASACDCEIMLKVLVGLEVVCSLGLALIISPLTWLKIIQAYMINVGEHKLSPVTIVQVQSATTPFDTSKPAPPYAPPLDHKDTV